MLRSSEHVVGDTEFTLTYNPEKKELKVLAFFRDDVKNDYVSVGFGKGWCGARDSLYADSGAWNLGHVEADMKLKLHVTWNEGKKDKKDFDKLVNIP